MNQRITEHKRALASLDYNMSAVAEHVIKTDHSIGWVDFEILDSQQELDVIWSHGTLERKKKQGIGILPQVYNCLTSRQNKS